MPTITVVVETARPADRVLAAAFDFSERRTHGRAVLTGHAR